MATACANVSLLSDRIDICYGRKGATRKFKMRLVRKFRIVVTHPKLLYDPNGERAARRDAKGGALTPNSHAAERHGADRTMQDEQNRLNGSDPWSSQQKAATHFLSDDVMWSVRTMMAVKHADEMNRIAKAIQRGDEVESYFQFSLNCSGSIGEGMVRRSNGDSTISSITGVTIGYEFHKGYWYEKTVYPDVRV